MDSRRALVTFGLAALILSPAGAAGSPGISADSTPPEIRPAIFGTPGLNSWYVSNVTLNWRVEDPESPILWWRGCDPATVTVDTAGAPFACEAASEGGTVRVEITIKVDKTPPSATPAPSPQPNQHGWHNAPLTIGFVASDALSGPDRASCTTHAYSGADTGGREFTGTCKDLAGNTSNPSTYTLKYDTTKPTATPAPSPQANQHGWHRATLTIGFVASDALSGADQASCTPPQGYTGPDTAGRQFTGTCKDLAGNTSEPSTYAVKFDATPPQGSASSRAPDANGWYNHQLRVDFTATDGMSGFDRCEPPKDYSGPDSSAATVSGTCFDKAGNLDIASLAFKYDSMPPEVAAATPLRPPEPSGWYTEPIAFDVRGTDTTSDIHSCPRVTYDGPEGLKASVTVACSDRAGNVGARSFDLKYDDTGPQVSPSAGREADVNGWFNHALTVRFVGTDGASGLASCVPPQDYSGPDTVFGVVTGTCRDNAGNVGLGSLAVKYDATAPQVDGANPDRGPDANGWYNSPLAVTFHGSDETSEIDACTVTRYAGPDNASASVAGSCSDRAGNPSGPAPFRLKYDSTAPTIVAAKVRAGNRSAAVSWETSPDTSLVVVVRSAGARRSGVTVYRGTGRSFRDTRLTNGVRYRYRLTGYDEARNRAAREVAATPTAPLLSPQAGAVVSSPPRLVWKARRGSTYYNVQVWRGRRIFSAWPTRRSLKLPRQWTYRGRRYRLTPGRYRWYVWPGLGPRAQKRFGPVLGSSSFVVR